jgi:cytochrome c
MLFNTFRTAAIVCMTVSISTVAVAEERGTREDAKAMVNAALAHIKKVGPDQAYKDFTDKSNAEWHKKDVYVFVYSFDNVGLAQGANAKLIGKNITDLKDQNGKLFVQEFAQTAKSTNGGWVSYDWAHPETKKVEPKVSYIHRIDGIDAYVGAGVYVSK